ncbi:MAG: AAA family ATPase, partial [Desulfobacterales bacterium]|nr:AAA family ATPase [Desulfobacterales bacterium]
MSYYQAFNFTREPFSNTPDPGLFYHSHQHREALQKLEIALRLRRGLNLVIGDVGLGKTTLSRQLIQRISHDDNLEYVLILDPGFSSEEEFLSFLLEQFTGTANFLQTSAVRLKEILKAHLFSRAQEEGKTLLLIIDEGQKLPDHCLEALRELLNYETNDHKLLQITIFAQKEFKITLKRHDNFNDRINFRYELTPLGFRDTRDLIFHRISASSDPNGLMAPQSPFTWGACLAIHRATQGSPRKIIHLCHHILMELIIHEKNQADYFFVRSRSGQILGRPSRIPFSRGLRKTSR